MNYIDLTRFLMVLIQTKGPQSKHCIVIVLAMLQPTNCFQNKPHGKSRYVLLASRHRRVAIRQGVEKLRCTVVPEMSVGDIEPL